ncbi:MAG: site-specific integrase [Gemmataceae bacterium]
MPAKPLMSWSKAQKRWEKMYKGQRFWVTCGELGLPADQHSKEASYLHANAWWTAKLATVQAQQAALHPHAEELKKLASRLDFAKRHGITDEAEVIEAEILRVRELPPASDDEYVPVASATPVRASHVEHRALKADDVWEDRLERATATPADRTIKALADVWANIKLDEARAGVRSRQDAESQRHGITHFVTHVGPSSPADAIDAPTWHRWYLDVHGRLNKGDWSADTCHKYFTISRTFVKWLYQTDILDRLPKNIDDPKYKFARPHRTPMTFTDDEVKTLLNAASGVHRLLFLLMLNTGATQTDVADLRKEEIDFAEGRITRRRSKMVKSATSRLVSYKLWPETAALLKEHLATDGDLALVTKSGKPWTWDELAADGKLRSSDNFASIFNNVVRKLVGKGEGKGPWKGKSAKLFRKSSATKIGNNPTYKDLTKYFLGHKETSVDTAHYVHLTQERLDAAVLWLRDEFGIADIK